MRTFLVSSNSRRFWVSRSSSSLPGKFAAIARVFRTQVFLGKVERKK